MLQGQMFFTLHSLANGLYTGMLDLNMFSLPNSTTAAALLHACGHRFGAGCAARPQALPKCRSEHFGDCAWLRWDSSPTVCRACLVPVRSPSPVCWV